MSNDIKPFDNHLHIICEATTPPEIAAGRWQITRSEMAAIMMIADALRGVDWPDEVDAAGDLIDGVLRTISPRYRRIRHLIALYFMTPAQQVRLIARMLQSNGVHGANVLLIPGTPRAAIDQVLMACAGTDLRVFVPYQYADLQGVAGIKHYPSLQHGQYDAAADAACALDLPIVSHCSPGGVRAPGMTQAAAKALNLPGRWLDIVRDRPVRLCLAHGGGNSWAKRMAQSKSAETCFSVLRYMMTEACPPTEWAGRLWTDTAFHDRQDTDDYAFATGRAVAPWRVLWGSDWPLHLPQWSYAQAVAWCRAYWGDQVAEQSEFSGRES